MMSWCWSLGKTLISQPAHLGHAGQHRQAPDHVPAPVLAQHQHLGRAVGAAAQLFQRLGVLGGNAKAVVELVEPGLVHLDLLDVGLVGKALREPFRGYYAGFPDHIHTPFIRPVYTTGVRLSQSLVVVTWIPACAGMTLLRGNDGVGTSQSLFAWQSTGDGLPAHQPISQPRLPSYPISTLPSG